MRFWSTLILVATTLNLLGQIKTYQYTVNEGLISNHVYCITQDSKGYLWFGTYNGVSRFDGKEFKNFNTSNGLLNNDVFIIEEDLQGRIWFGTYLGGLCYYQNDTILPFAHNDSLKPYLVVKSAKMSMHFDSLGNIFLGDAVRGMLKIDSSGHIDTLGRERRNVFDLSDRILTSHRKNLNKGKNYKYGINQINFFKGEDHENTFIVERETAFAAYLLGNHYAQKIGEDSILLTQGTLYLKYFNGEIEKQFMNQRADALYVDESRRVWIGHWYDGFKVWSDHNLNELLIEGLNGETITDIEQDFQGGYWLASLDHGVFHFPSLPSFQISTGLPKAKVRSITKGPGDDLFLLYDNADVWWLSGSNSKLISSFDERGSREGSHIYYDDETSTLYVKGKVHDYDSDKFNIEHIPLFRASSPPSRSYATLKFEGELCDMRGRGLYQWVDDSSIYRTGRNLEYNRVQSYSIFNDTLWFGTLNGLFYYSKGMVYKKNDIYSDYKITAMTSKGNMSAFAAESRGIVVRESSGISEIKNERLLHSAKIFDLEIDDQSRIIVATSKGLFFCQKIDQNWSVYKLSPQQADVQEVIYDIKIVKEVMHLATEKGLISMPLSVLEKSISPPLTFIDLTRIGGQPVNHVSGVSLDYNQNSLEILFTAIDYSENNDLVYSWKFDRKNEAWIETKNSSLYLDKLNPGNYTVLLKSSSSPGIWSDVNSFSFEIRPPIWGTWYFILSCILGLSGIIFIFIYRRIRKVRKDAETELELLKEKNELEMKALRAQMNPHFIFNTLTAIQFLIQSRQNEKAQFFLVKFSQLLRRITDTSQDSSITLKEELDILQTYVDLQNLRFKNKFEYKLNLNNELRTDEILIPGLILQPFVENAIQHGLSKKEGQGLLVIDVKRHNGQLNFSITDNGIGRKKSKEFKLGRMLERRSVGISNVSSRLNIINFENKDLNGSVTVTDLYDSENQACGTRVELNVKYETTDIPGESQ